MCSCQVSSSASPSSSSSPPSSPSSPSPSSSSSSLLTWKCLLRGKQMCSCQVSELSSLNFGKLYKAIKSVTDNISQSCVLPNIYILLNTSSNCNHLHQQVLLTTSISVLRGGGRGWQGPDQVLHSSSSRWQLHADHGRGERQRRWSSPHSEWGQKWNKYKCSHALDPWALAMLIR